MRLLLDALEDSGNTLVVSAASAWELATKWRLGKLPHARVVVENYSMARQAVMWAVPHRDPFDRLLAAQARADELVLASTDPAFAQFDGVVTLR